MTRRAYQVTSEHQNLVKILAISGVEQDVIAKAIGVTAKTLRKYYAEDLENAAIHANAAVTGTLYRIATGKYPGATAQQTVVAAMFWAKTRMGWRETENKQHSGEVTIKMLSGDDKL